MAETTNVFLVFSSFEENRPQIDYSLEYNKRNDWRLIGEVLDGARNEKEFPLATIFVQHAEAKEWDFYNVAGISDLISERALDLLAPFASEYFRFFQVWLNGSSYFLLKGKKTLDCLDRKQSVLLPFTSNPDKVMDIKEYRFHKELIKDPLIFTIPERPYLLATQSIEQIIRRERLRGFYLVDAESVTNGLFSVYGLSGK